MAKPDDHPPRCTGTTARGTRCTRAAIAGSTRCRQHGFNVKAVGRPSKLTDDVAEVIVGLVLEGNYLKTAAAAAGVTERTLHRWLERADDIEASAMEHVEPDAEDVDLYSHTDPADWRYLDFRQSLKAAEAYAETELLRMVRYPGFGPWQAAMTILERRRPQHWRRRETHEVEHGGTVGVRVREVTPEGDNRRRIAGILQETGALDAAVATDERTHDGNDPTDGE